MTRIPVPACVHTAAFVAALALATLAEAAGVDCLDTDAALAYWRPLKAEAALSESPADELALELESCLASPNAELRDRIGYELYTLWLRSGRLADATRRALLNDLRANLGRREPTAALERSFSALILAEVMRSDANQPFMTDAERQALLDAAGAALMAESDFRGLEPEIGWVHPVAHLADLLWRFALHPQTTGEQAKAILAAVDARIAPTSVFYHFNEADRLARVSATLVRRGLIEPADTIGWLQGFQVRRSGGDWPEAFQSREGMAELHNTKLFLRALSDQLGGADFDGEVAELLHALVSGFTQLI